MSKVVAEIGGEEIELVAVEDTEFQKIMDSDRAELRAVPTMYRASNPKDVWPLPRKGVTLRYD